MGFLPGRSRSMTLAKLVRRARTAEIISSLAKARNVIKSVVAEAAVDTRE